MTRADRPRVFSACGREWDLLAEVFAPVYSPSTNVALEFLDLGEKQGRYRRDSFLEIGCGAGVIAVMAALSGCERVVASDINPWAVENAAVNAGRHGMRGRVRTVHGDMFSGIDAGERFDTVFWSSNYVRGPEGYEYKTLHEAAYVDIGYRAHRAYIAEAPRRVAEGGSALLHFSSRGDLPELHRIAEEYGRELRTIRSMEVHEGEYGDDVVEHLLLEITPAAVGAE
ncbi:50S ribosomal protein L11 methyltransferase [Streptomyces sp. NBC_00344]|uniref:50S ribosomal protein L11 methyltransferase n=1 Tax=Streptomyces sp. NBC_00344 TaxID=2975720 RepID=UPI002E2367B1